MRALPAEAWVQQLRDLPTWVAVDRGEDVGMVRASDAPGQPELAWLISMWVAPQGRGRGIGRRLTYAVLEWAHATERSRVALGVHTTNLAAKALYARMGFEPTTEFAADACEETWVRTVDRPIRHP